MSLTISQLSQLRSLQKQKQLQIAIVIDGYNSIIGSGVIYEDVKIGDDLIIGDDWVIGGTQAYTNQTDEVLISLDGSTTAIDQQLNIDDGSGTSVQQFDVALIDKDGQITQLITPDEVVDDMLARRVDVLLGYSDTSYPEDYIKIFSGIVQKIRAKTGKVTFTVAHPDQKKRQDLFIKATTELASAITGVAGETVSVVSNTDFSGPVLGPDGTNDSSLKFYLKVDDEIMRYTAKGTNEFTVTERGCFDTTAATHESGASVESYLTLEGLAMELALKIMLSGKNGYCLIDKPIASFVRVEPDETVANAVKFNVDVEETYGVTVGDWMTVEDATNGANNFTMKEILLIVKSTEGSSYVVVDDVSLVEEINTDAIASFRSQYDTLGEGLGMSTDEVDVYEHQYKSNLFLSSFEYLFYIKDTVQAREFIEKELYLPCGAFSVPRKARCSVGYHSQPIPGEVVKVLDSSNILNPKNIEISRSITENFYNTIVYKFDDDPVDDKFWRSLIHVDATSLERIKAGGKIPLTIESKGMRSDLNAVNLADIISERRLDRYKFAAEKLNIEINLGVGLTIEIGDIVIFDGRDLNVSDITNGTRVFQPRFFEVINKRFDIKTGRSSLTLLDTNYSTIARYGKIGPASLVSVGLSQTQFVIKSSFAKKYGANEWMKWINHVGKASVLVRSSSGAISGNAILDSVSGNTITVRTALGFVPAVDYVMELSHYNSQDETIKLLYAFMTDNAAFDDGKDPYQML